MNKKIFSAFGFCIFALSHLALIPVLSIFGLNVCPNLQEQGFLFGCQYAAKFACSVLVIQSSFLVIFFWILNYVSKTKWTNLVPILSSPIWLAIHFLNFYINSSSYEQILSEHSPYSKDVNLFLWVCMSMILVVSWQWIETEITFKLRSLGIKDTIPTNTANIFWIWFYEQKNRLIPVMGLVLFFGSYFSLMFIRQESWEDPKLILSQQKEKFFYLTFGVVVWQILIYFFDFYRNLILSKEIEQHLLNIRDKNFKFRSTVSGSGFFSIVFNLLNQLSETLVKKSRLLKGFSSFVSETVAEKILITDDHVHSGESKQVAVLMADIRDFTSFSSQMKSQEVVNLLNIYFSDMIEVFIENGITVDKFIGDGILAYAIDNSQDSNHIYDAMLKTAFDMHFKLQQTNAKLKSQKLPKIQIGVGLHEGRVVLGSIGSREKLQYTIIGDPVNVSARLEGFCKDKQVGIIVSSHFYHRISQKNHVKFQSLGMQRIRGLELPMEIFGALPYEKKHSSVA